MHRWTARNIPFTFLLLLIFGLGDLQADSTEVVFNILDYGATGHKDDDARPAIQSAIDLCAAAGVTYAKLRGFAKAQATRMLTAYSASMGPAIRH